MLNCGKNLKYFREFSGLNQPELAKKIGTSQANISRWERDEVIPNIEFCAKMAEFYGITIDELLGISGDAKTVTSVMGETYTAEERKLIEIYQSLSPDMQGALWSLLKTWAPETEIPTFKKV